jgi:hypothetical protein
MVMAAPHVQVHEERRTPAYGSVELGLWLGNSYRRVRPHTKAKRGGTSAPRLPCGMALIHPEDQQSHGRANMVNE